MEFRLSLCLGGNLLAGMAECVVSWREAACLLAGRLAPLCQPGQLSPLPLGGSWGGASPREGGEHTHTDASLQTATCLPAATHTPEPWGMACSASPTSQGHYEGAGPETKAASPLKLRAREASSIAQRIVNVAELSRVEGE